LLGRPRCFRPCFVGKGGEKKKWKIGIAIPQSRGDREKGKTVENIKERERKEAEEKRI